MNEKELLVFIPAHNEEENIEKMRRAENKQEIMEILKNI